MVLIVACEDVLHCIIIIKNFNVHVTQYSCIIFFAQELEGREGGGGSR